MPNPEISVIMPVYNAAKYLNEAIESILNQTFKDFELIILNDCSTDASFEIIKQNQLKDSRIIVVDKEKNVGPANLRNEGIVLAKGKFIALMDADDVSLPTRFEKQLAVFRENLKIGLCGTWFELFGFSILNQTIKHFETHDVLKVKFLTEDYIGNPTVMVRKEIIQNHKFNPEFEPMEDYELWSRLIFETEFYNIQEVLLNYRWHETNISHSRKVNLKEIHETIRKNQLLTHLGIQNNYNYCFLVLNYQKKQTPTDCIKIIQQGEILIKKNRALKKYNCNILESDINKTILQTIINAEYYTIKFLIFLLINKHFKKLSRNELKIVFKSFLALKSDFKFLK